MKDKSIPRYLVKKNLPLKENPLIKGDIVDSNNPCFTIIDIENTEYFDLVVEGRFDKDDEILYKVNKYDKLEFYIVIQNFHNGQYRIQNVKSKAFMTITDRSKYAEFPTKFWFINSNGAICTDFEERDNISIQGLKFKKQTGNYFLTNEEAKLRRECLN